MDRKDFIRKGILGTGAFIAGSALASENGIDELRPLEPMGFNHLPLSDDTRMSENMVVHRSDTRGRANHGWLYSRHTFSFANYYHPERMHFGALRVLNDDHVEAGRGFGTHPHDNMEIVSIPLEGDLEHRDSMGNVAVIRHGEVQVMSAGKGITHSEFNRNSESPVKFLQIWMFPNARDVEPRYDQLQLNPVDRVNRLQQILSPSSEDDGVWVHQDAWWHMGKFDEGVSVQHPLHRPLSHGVYAFILSGTWTLNGTELGPRDGMGVWGVEALDLQATSGDAEILLMEVPMALS
jgi:redox-sensitive bicupin YhaK (pirin superfamily)